MRAHTSQCARTSASGWRLGGGHTCARNPTCRAFLRFVCLFTRLRSGKLDVFEASAVLGRKALDRGLQFQQVIDAFDVSGDGLIDFEEFERLFMMLVEIGLIPRPRHGG